MTLTLLDDSFTRANAAAGGVGSTAVGNGWIEVLGTLWSISGNQLICNSEGGGTAWARDWLLRPPSEKRRDAQVIVDFPTTLVSSQWGGAVLRAQLDTAGRDAYLCYVQFSSGVVQIWKVTGATRTTAPSISSLKSGSFTFTAGHQYELTFSATGASPTTLAATLVDVTNSNTTVVSISVTDSTASLQTAGYMGLVCPSGTGVPFSRARTQDIGAASLVAYGGPTAGIGGPINVNSTGNVITLVGNTAAWTAGSPGTPTFTLSGGTGASITSQTVIDANHAQITVNAGSATGPLTITDPSTGLTTTVSVQTPVTVTDANLFLSPYNWYLSGSTYAQATNGGAYLKLGFTGTSCTLLLDMSPLAAAAAQGSGGGNSSFSCPKLRWSIDNAPWSDQYLSPSGIMTLATGLAAGTHQLELYLTDWIGQLIDRWNVPSGVARITGFQLDPTAVTAAPTLQSKRVLLYGDSITEGKLTTLDPTNSASYINDSTQSYALALAYGLAAEVGTVAFSGQTVAGTGLAIGNVPSLYNSTTPSASAWDKYDANHSRLVGGLLSPQPDYIVQNLGVNDQSGVVATIQASYTAWLQAIRTAAPNALIFCVLPFARPAGPVTAIQNAIAAVADPKVYLVDLGTIPGLAYASGPATNLASDALHPVAYGHERVTSYLAAALQKQFDGVFGSGSSSPKGSLVSPGLSRS